MRYQIKDKHNFFIIEDGLFLLIVIVIRRLKNWERSP